jgi:Xaa-Pro dipeptidase
VRTSVRATEVAVARLRAAMRPGLSEKELWSVLHQGVIALGGDYVETRPLSSGPRTNPWFQETADRRLAENELVALDTDVVGCHGYYCDFSRTFHTGPGDPTRRQRELYQVAHEQVHHNMELLRAGTSFPGLLGAGLEDPGALRGQPLLRLRPRMRHDRRVPLPLPQHGLREIGL